MSVNGRGTEGGTFSNTGTSTHPVGVGEGRDRHYASWVRTVRDDPVRSIRATSPVSVFPVGRMSEIFH